MFALKYGHRSLDFVDIEKKEWYFEVVAKSIYDGLMCGTSFNHFEPDANMTRAMVATVLYRMAGQLKVEYTGKFKDVANNIWYTKAIEWAASANVVSGYQDGNFGCDDPITRQDLAIMLSNFAKAYGIDTIKQVDLASFKDQDKVESYAQSAIAFCIEAGFMSGSNQGDGKYINPTANATRAQCAKMFSLLNDAMK